MGIHLTPSIEYMPASLRLDDRDQLSRGIREIGVNSSQVYIAPHLNVSGGESQVAVLLAAALR